MPARYAPLPAHNPDPDAADELEAAFDGSDDEDDAPAVTARNGYHPLAHEEPTPAGAHARSRSATYDFEAGDFDYTRPPPGSPPGPSDRALPNEFGNTNGLVPASVVVGAEAAASHAGWLRRTAASVLPARVSERLGLDERLPAGAVGGGSNNDGVFANVTAKPSRPVRIQEGDETYLVPEESQKDVPPSYAAAQADAVPPYWETTIHAPSSSNNPGDVIIDSLPTGSLFSFLWNMLVSISFQFVGFLLTYLLHTTHAAKLGSRAGLGITLIQYGFAMRAKGEEGEGSQGAWTVWRPSGDNSYYGSPYDNSTMDATPTIPTQDENAPIIVGDGTSEWLSFLLMTIGWFILLTSLLGFYRVKRWERGILASHRDAPPSGDARPRATMLHSLERVFGMQGLADGSLIRTGLGLPLPSRGHSEDAELQEVVVEPSSPPLLPVPGEQYVLPIDPSNPQRNDQVAQAFIMQARLQHDLRSAGLL